MKIFGSKKEEKQDSSPAKKVADVKVAPKKKDKALEPKQSKDQVSKSDIKTTKKEATQKVAYRILLRPIISEKSSVLSSLNQYVFEVSTKSNKIEVKKAIEEVYKVKPVKVRMINKMGKLVRSGRGKQTRRKSWKKAIVSLKAGDKIEIYEGV